MKEEQNEGCYCLTASECMRRTLMDYGIDVSGVTQKVLEHLVNDFMELMVKQGHAKRAKNAEN